MRTTILFSDALRACAPGQRSIMGGLALVALFSVARAAEPDPSVAVNAERLAVGVCGTCHGARGISTHPKFPNLAGQNANYLAAQLKNFRAQSRGDPDAIGYMWGMAGSLKDDTIDALAKYYAAQAAQPSRTRDPATIARGRELYTQGITAQGVPACALCHGPDAHGLSDFPRLAGQHSQYVLKQLGSFQSNMRDVAIMHGVAKTLNLEEMQAIADYLEAQP